MIRRRILLLVQLAAPLVAVAAPGAPAVDGGVPPALAPGPDASGSPPSALATDGGAGDGAAATASPAPAASPSTAPAPPLVLVPFSGLVKEAGTRIPLGNVEVIVVVPGQEPIAVRSDDEGRFDFGRGVPPGRHKVAVRGSGYVPADTEDEFNPGKRRESIFYLRLRQRYTTVVRGAKLVKQTVEQTITVEEIKKIPGTQGDALKSIQTLPGVARAPFGLGNLIVWGSNPADTRAYVNGVYIPTVYHFGGLRSTVNTDLILALDFTPGGYGVDYGRGMGGIVEVETRRPKTQGIHGSIDLSLIDGAIRIEGAPTKNLSLFAAVRRSWVDAVLKLVQTNAFQLSPTYWDYQLALYWRASKRDDIEVIAFGSDDQIQLITKSPNPDLQGQFSNQTYYHRVVARYTHRFHQGTVLTITPSIGFDRPANLAGNFGGFTFSASSTGFLYALRAVARIPVTSFLRLDAGVDFEGRRGELKINIPAVGGLGASMSVPRVMANRLDDTAIHIIQTAPYLNANFRLLDGRLALTPGLRVELALYGGYWNTPDAFAKLYPLFEPRLSGKYEFNRYVALKGAMGAYHQPPTSANLLRQFGNPELRPQEAYHYLFGVDVNPTPTTHIEVLGFYKELRNLVVPALSPVTLLDNGGIGRVYGGELLVKQNMFKNFYGWISYTVSRAERKDRPNDPWRLFDFDQTHILSLVASYQLPKGFQIGARFRYITGNPTTLPVGWYQYSDYRDSGYRRIDGPRFAGRLEDFHQLDIRIDKEFVYRLWKLGLYLDIQNVYNRANPEAIQYADRPLDCERREDCQAAVSGLPILPVIGVRGEF